MVKIKEIKEEEIREEKWRKYYSSSHEILLVGEGDFSFALCLALSFHSASNIVATTLDSFDSLTKKYKRAKSNLELLEKLGASLIHGVDATKMKLHTDLKMRKFDRIIFNFPHAGFHGKEGNLHLIKMHRRLVDGFFHNASGMLRPNGEIHVNHKTSAPFCQWDIEDLASRNSLVLLDCVPFKITDYPGYRNKRGDGSRCDEPFHLGECCTFKFIFSSRRMRMCSSHSRRTSRNNLPHHQLQKFMSQEQHPKPRSALNSSDLRYNLDNAGSPVRDRFGDEFVCIFLHYFTHVEETFGLPEERIGYNVQDAISQGYRRFSNMASGRPKSDFIMFLKELHRLSLRRIEWLERSLDDMCRRRC